MKRIIISVIVYFIATTLNFAQTESPNTSKLFEEKTDSLPFVIAQQKFENSSSGYICFNANYVNSNFEYHWDIDLLFTKDKSNITSFYIKLWEDTTLNEFAYLNDTLLINATYNSKQVRDKHYSSKPFEGNVKDIITDLITEDIISHFLTYTYTSAYDTLLKSKTTNAYIGLGKDTVIDSPLTGHYNSKVIIDEDYNLHSCFNQVQIYRDNALFFTGYKEYIIDEVYLHSEKIDSISSIIENKYNKLSSTIITSLDKTSDTITQKPITQEIPEYALNWKLPLINGDTLDSNNIDSKILVMDFYYTSCAPCILAIYDLIKLDSIYNDSDVFFIGANVLDHDTIKINKFIKDKKILYPNVYNAKELGDQYGFYGYPQLLFIDTKTGKIIYHSKGHRGDAFNIYKGIIDDFLDMTN